MTEMTEQDMEERAKRLVIAQSRWSASDVGEKLHEELHQVMADLAREGLVVSRRYYAVPGEYILRKTSVGGCVLNVFPGVEEVVFPPTAEQFANLCADAYGRLFGDARMRRPRVMKVIS